MKRTFLFLLTAVLLGAGLCSCDKEGNIGGDSVDNNGVNNGDNNGGDNGDDNGGGGSGDSTTTVQWMDLGLPSGLLWADRNVGADNPEDYGNYYAWGETTPKEVYWWITYAYGNAYDTLTKYCNDSYYGLNGFTDNLTTLVASDDAATANIGGDACMPTEDEWQELIDNTTGTWTTLNGVYGRLLTASNGKSVFLPAAGSRYGTDLNFAGKRGYYWSSTLYMDSPSHARYFLFGSYYQTMDHNSRDHGFSVRAVRASQN